MPSPKINLDTISEEDLLEVRLCDLPIQIQGHWIEGCVEELYRDLKNKGILFRPKCYLADEWLSPDLEPVVGIPFYLAHPTLMRLEKKMMLEVEGEVRDWCMKLLRHETGHAINYAYKFFKRKKWREIFGSFTTEYKDIYRFRPYSKNYVRHLEDYYAQYHPDEDFAETFAVWLDPECDWETEYQNWKALDKLKYIDKIMTSIRGKPPLVKKGKDYWNVARIKKTIKTYYKQRKNFHAEDFPSFHDINLMKTFSVQKDKLDQSIPAEVMIRKHRTSILQSACRWTGEKKYIANDLINKIIKRCHELKLVCTEDETVTMVRITTYITTLLMNYLYTGRLRGEKWQKN